MKNCYDKLRNMMVEEQLISRGIHDEMVINAFRNVPRERFVPQNSMSSSYEDHPLAIGYGQTISQPYMVALMTQSLALSGKEKVLEVGTGSGYQTAVLAEIAKEVYSIERFPELAQNSGRVLNELGYKNVKIKTGDGTLGWQEYAPFDGIIVTAGAPKVPQPLIEQLGVHGRMVIPIGTNFGQMLKVISKINGKAETHDICYCVFVPLVGKHGWAG